MCGIFGYVGKKNNAAELVLDGLKLLEYRGYDSWGVGIIQNGEIKIDKHIGKIGAAATNLPASTIACGHTRWATHGGVTNRNAHPHLDCTKKVAVMHNGIVENYLTLKNELGEFHTYVSQTDTEVISHLVETELEERKDIVSAVRNTFLKLDGRNAIIAMYADTKTILVAKNGSPIVLGIGKEENFIASDASALLPHTRQVVFLEDGQMATIEEKKVQVFDIATGQKLPLKVQLLEWKIEAAEKGNYSHFLLKEIYEQPESIARAANQNREKIVAFEKLIKNSFGTYIIGCGTAAHACRMATYIFSVIAKRHLNFCVGSEFAYFQHFLTPKSLIIAASQSGETADILEAVDAAKSHKSKIASLVNALGSTLERESDLTMPLKAGPEKSVLSTKAFTAKLTIFYLLAFTLTGEYEEGRKKLLETADAVGNMLTDAVFIDKVKEIAEKLYTVNDMYILGRGLSYPIALEASHKIKEACYIHSESFAGGEPKHCEISLISKGTPTIVFVPNDETKAAILSNAMEFKARGAYIIGISPENQGVFDDWIPVPDLGITSSITNVIPAQLLAYYLAIKRKCDPDMPRNLAKSVTVK